MRLIELSALLLSVLPQSRPAIVHSVSDISQEFSFYMDGRFHRQYLSAHGRDVRNWGTLSRLELDNVNLLLLTEGDARIPYTVETLERVEGFLRAGGTVLMMADGADPAPPGAALAERFGARLDSELASAPLAASGSLERLVGAKVPELEFRRGGTLRLQPGWTKLVVDSRQRPVLAKRRIGEGQLLLGSRGLFGQRPDASDPINAAWITPLLVGLASTLSIDASRPPRSTRAEHSETLGPLTLEYTDGTRPFAAAIAREYELVRPHLIAITGVEPAAGMIKNLLILPTGGGGFSSGARIAIGAWWGNYPEQRYKMVELIAHEAGHSWVLPHAEPLWNEPIATYLGIQVGRRLGMPDAQRTLERQLERGRGHDEGYARANPLAEGAPRDLVWGKSYFVFEELERLHGPGALAKYFRTKRRVLAADRPGYSFDDCVAVWSLAVERDLFPWFAGLGFDVVRSRTEISAP